MRMRIGLLALLLFFGAGAVSRRAFELQVERTGELRTLAEEQYLRDIRLSPKRGTVMDRNGAELAVSADVDSVWANPRQLRRSGGDAGKVARRLSELLGTERARIEKRLHSDRYFVWIKRRVTPQQAKAVALLDLPGVQLTAESRRFYPNRSLGAHVLGFANIDGKGIEGLELHENVRLQGASDSVPAIRDRRGVIVFSEQLLDDRATQGDDIVLSLDRTIQHVAEREIELTVRTFEAKGGSAVVLDPLTGEILAMASYPRYNPNDAGSAPADHRRNRAITDRFEPGSTMKPFTVAGALAHSMLGANQLIDCQNGEMEVAEYTIHDTFKWGKLRPAEILAYSSNIGTAKIGMALGRERLYRVLRDFGFGEKSGVPLPGETSGILRHYKRWYEMDVATISFGQGMSTTTLQLASAMGVLANKGRLMKPILIKRVLSARGEVLEEAAPKIRRQVVPPKVARLVGDMLTAVTGEGGTGVEAAIEGYLVAGKTGTAQKADYIHGGYAKGKWTSSFVGFAPADAPRLVTAVVIDEPVIAYYGGTVAGPPFRRITEAALRHLGVPAKHHGEALARRARKRRRARAEEAGQAAGNARDDTDKDDKAELPPLEEGERRVPDLLGLTARAAVTHTHREGLLVRLKGSGVVVSQSPAPAAVVAEGTKVEALLAAPSHLREQADDDDPVAGNAPKAPTEQAPLALNAAGEPQGKSPARSPAALPRQR